MMSMDYEQELKFAKQEINNKRRQIDKLNEENLSLADELKELQDRYDVLFRVSSDQKGLLFAREAEIRELKLQLSNKVGIIGGESKFGEEAEIKELKRKLGDEIKNG